MVILCDNSTLLRNSTEIINGWVDGPKLRGTWQILYSCTFTLVLCVYTAIHLNVPKRGESRWAYWARVAKWVAVAIFGPEIIVFMAIDQWLQARTLKSQLVEYAEKCQDLEFQAWYHKDGKKSKPFGMAYAYYAIMGGFAADVSHLHNTMEQLTITPRGMIFLAKNGYFCRLKSDEIEDKSKADSIAKGLVCIQVLWLLGQTIERKVAGLPITMLELHTLVHVFCAIVMYALWLQKPHRVQCPTMVPFTDQQGLLACMIEMFPPWDLWSELHLQGGEVMKQKSKVPLETFGFSISRPGYVSKKWQPTVYLVLDEEANNPRYDGADNSTWATPMLPNTTLRSLKTSDYTFVPNGNQPVLTLAPGETLGRLAFVLRNSVYTKIGDQLCGISLSSKDVLRYESLDAAWDGMKAKGALISGGRAKNKSGQQLAFVALQDEFDRFPKLTSLRMKNLTTLLPNIDSDREFISLLVINWILLPCAYGAVHLIALAGSFVTDKERLLWRVSCWFIISIGPPFASVIIYLFVTDLLEDYLTNLNWYESKWRKRFKRLGSWLFVPALIFCIFYSVAYVVARVFIVVESFISLRALPAAIFALPERNIMNNIPHL